MPSLRGRRSTRLAAYLLSIAALLPGAGSALAQQTAACPAFMTSMTQALADQQIRFEHPLLVSRNAPSFGMEVYDLVSANHVDGTLHCRRNHLVRFEAKITMPGDGQLLKDFEKVQEAALAAALHWPPARATSTLHSMNAEAAEYLRASIERGDVYLAGKTEYHENGTDLGMLWTKTDRTFIISRPE